MPVEYGSYVAARRRLERWSREGIWAQILEALVFKSCSMGKLSLGEVTVKGTTVEARKGAAHRI